MASEVSTTQSECVAVAAPPKGTFYELDHCSRARIFLTESNEGATCGCELLRPDCPYILYCSAPATRQAISGCWTCSAHCKRPSLDLPQARINHHKWSRLSGFGVNYTYPGEPPKIHRREIKPAVEDIEQRDDESESDCSDDEPSSPASSLILQARPQIIVDAGVRSNGQSSIEVNGQNGGTKVMMSHSQLPALNMPGREVFGPLNEEERLKSLELVKRIQRAAAMWVMQAGNPEMKKLLQDIAPLFERLMNDSCAMGPVPLAALLDEYVACLEKAARSKAQ